MLDGNGGRPRLTWNSVTDAGGTPTDVGAGGSGKSGFEFDLGGALARLAGDDDEISAPAPRQSVGAEVMPDRTAPTPPRPVADTSSPSVAPPESRLPGTVTPAQEPPTAPTPDRPATPMSNPAPTVSPPPVPPMPQSAPEPVPPMPQSAPDPMPPVPPSVPEPVPPVPPSAPDSMPPEPRSAPDPMPPEPRSAPEPMPPSATQAVPQSTPPQATQHVPPTVQHVPTTTCDSSSTEPLIERDAFGAGVSGSGPVTGEQRGAGSSWTEPMPKRDAFGSGASGSETAGQRGAGSSWTEPLPEHDPFRSGASGSGSGMAGQRRAGSSWTEPLPEHDPFGGRGSGSGPVTAEQHKVGQAEHASIAREQVTRRAVEAEPAVTNYPRRVPGTHFDSQRQPENHVAEPTAPAPADPPQPVQQQSVFEDSGSNASPMLPGSTPGAPGLPSTPAADASAAPSLPEAVAAPPPVAEPMSDGPANSDITALRSTQMRASRQQKPGRLFGRSLLAFVLIGGVLGAGLYFGRSFLYPTDWDAQLTPIVNELQDARGVEFDETVPLVAQPPEQYGDQLVAATIGSGWVDRVPEWRALGLASGEVSEATVGASLAGSTTAFYDPDARTIYRVDGIAAAQADLRIALTAALDHQQSEANTAATDDDSTADADGESGEQVDAEVGAAAPVGAAIVSPPGFTGVSPLSSIAGRAVDRVLVFGSADAREPAAESLPMPIAYEVAAVDILGESIVAAAGVDRATLVPGGPYPDSITTALDDRAVEATAGLLEPGDNSLADPVSLGTDDWSLVWGVRLPEITVDTLLAQVVADSYRPIDRGGTVCFIGVFEAPDELSGGVVLAAMQSWAVSSPVSAQAVATSLGATRVQLQACDPGDVESAPNVGVVDALIDRQQLRLTN